MATSVDSPHSITTEIAWAAGFIEGEGCVQVTNFKSIVLSAVQISREPLDRLVRLFGGTICRPKRQYKNNSLIHKWDLCGPRAAAAIMTIYVLMSEKRKKKMREALAVWRTTDAKRSGVIRVWGMCPKAGLHHTIRERPDGRKYCVECAAEKNRKLVTRHRERYQTDPVYRAKAQAAARNCWRRKNKKEVQELGN